MTDRAAPPKLLIVDEDAVSRQKIAHALHVAGYQEVIQVSAAETAERALETQGPFALVILDVRLPDGSGLALLAKLAPQAPQTVTIMTTAGQGVLTAIDCLKRGAYDYVLKPVDAESILLSVGVALKRRQHELAELQRHREVAELVEERLSMLEQTRSALVGAICRLAEFGSPHYHVHPERVARYSEIVAHELGRRSPYAPFVTHDFLHDIAEAALLHDIGKLGLPDSILIKPEDLTPEEEALLQTHTTLGRDICLSVLGQLRSPGDSFIHMAAEVTGSHHERWDGNGFPDRLKETQVPLSARIVSLADYYDVWRTPMVYRPDWLPPAEVAEMIFDQAGTKFDPVVVEAFRRSRMAIAEVEEELTTDYSVAPRAPEPTHHDSTLVF